MRRGDRGPTCQCGHGPAVHTLAGAGACRLARPGRKREPGDVDWRGCGCQIWRPVPYQRPQCRCDDCLRATTALLQAERTVLALVQLVDVLRPKTLPPLTPEPVTAIEIPQQRGIRGLPARTRPGRS